MRKQWLFQLTRLLAVALLSLGAEAHAESAITGTVVSAADKKPLLDIVVTATSPALQGEQVVVTDAQGRYRISSLPPGIYRLRFQRGSEFHAFERSDIQLRENRTIRVNVELTPSDVELGYITLGPCGIPVVDTTSSATGLEVDAAFLQHTPVNRPTDPGGAARHFDGLAELAPGTRRDAYGVSIHGALGVENASLVDGFYSTDPVSGAQTRPLSVEFLEDVKVITSGYMPEYGRSTGGILETSTRSGSNEFHGSVFANWAPGTLEGARTPVRAGDVTGGSGTSLKNLGDFGGTLGGPLVKDKLWFFAGVAPALTRWEQTRAPTGDPRTVFADQRAVQALGKLTYLINTDHNVSVSLSTTPTSSGGEGRLTVAPPTNSNFTHAAVLHRGAFLDKELLFDTSVAWSRWTSTAPSSEVGDVQVDRYLASSEAYYRLKLAGEHLLKAGLEAELRESELPSRSMSHLLGGYVQDSWSFSRRFTINAGVRFDAWSLDVGDSQGTRVRSNPLSPRLGVVVDALADGRVKLFAHYAKYQAPVLLRARTDSPVVPDVILPASTEVVGGAEFELPASLRLGALYTHRDLGAASGGTAERTYDAGTVALSRFFSDGWLAEVSYTASRLRGSDLGPLWVGASGGPGFDFSAPVEGQSGVLPSDRTHSIKAIGGRRFSLSETVSASLGLSYRGSSGAPIPAGADSSTERTPWVHAVDSNLRIAYQAGRDSELAFALTVFNLLNAQEVTRSGEVGTGVVEPVEYQAPRQVRLGARYTF